MKKTKIIALILITIVSIMSCYKVKAATVGTSSVQYRLYWYEYGYSNNAGNSSYTNAGTGIDLSGDGRTVKLVYSFNTIFNFGNNTLVAGRKYKVVMTYTLSPTSNLWQNNYKRDTQFLFSGSTNGNTWNDGYIEEATSTIKPNCGNCDRNTATFYITPNTNINYLRIIMRIPPNNRELDTFDRNKAYAWNYANLPAGDYIKVTYTNDETAQAVQELTSTIVDLNEQIIDILDGDYEFNQNPSENIDGKDDIDDYTEEEEDLLESLDLEVEDAEVTINPYASSFIWEIANRLRGMNGKIVLLFTSVLSLGLIKMVLNR